METEEGENSGHLRELLPSDDCPPIINKSNELSCLDLELTVSNIKQTPGSWLLGER